MYSQVAVTPGEPSGIGIDLCVLLSQQYFPKHYTKGIYAVVIADVKLLMQRAKLLNLPLHIHTSIESFQTVAGIKSHILVHPVTIPYPVTTGLLNPGNAHYVIKTLDIAIDGCLNKRFAALVTGPVHKANIMQANIPFTGHTEYLAHKSQSETVAMSFYMDNLLLGLVTTHLPLKEVSKHITDTQLKSVIELTHATGKKLFNTDTPRIKVCGLNPHAGENGYLGTEEIDIINPVIKAYQQQGLNIVGSVPADTAFLPQNLANTDILIAMYHDQGLATIKHMAFSTTVNLTLGLPFIRTSVDHGTALDLAGTHNIQTENMQAAFGLAVKLIT
jgi:4-hydroxythreonine-4-phosphate dehydrogenase